VLCYPARGNAQTRLETQILDADAHSRSDLTDFYHMERELNIS